MAGYVMKSVVSSKTNSLKEGLGLSEKKKSPFSFGDDKEDDERSARERRKEEDELRREQQKDQERRAKRDEERAKRNAEQAKRRDDIRAKYGIKTEGSSGASSRSPAASEPPKPEGGKSDCNLM